MGGSLAAAIRRAHPHSRVTGVSRNSAALKTALKKGWIHEADPDLASAATRADLIVLCTPVSAFENMLAVIDRVAQPGTLVTDVGSVKGGFLKKLLAKKWRRIQYVSAHPMAGSHASGIQSATPHLYDLGELFLITSGRSTQESQGRVKLFWKKIMPRVVEVSAEDHDAIVAEISHLPHLVAVCLALTVGKKAVRHAASGFKDMTRLALGSGDIWTPILKANASKTLQALTQLEVHLAELRRALKLANSRELHDILQKAARRRAQI